MGPVTQPLLIPDDTLSISEVQSSKKKRATRQLGTNRISKRHRKFLFDIYPIFRFASIHDFQVVTQAGYEICALMDIDKNNRPIDQLLPNLF